MIFIVFYVVLHNNQTLHHCLCRQFDPNPLGVSRMITQDGPSGQSITVILKNIYIELICLYHAQRICKKIPAFQSKKYYFLINRHHCCFRLFRIADILRHYVGSFSFYFLPVCSHTVSHNFVNTNQPIHVQGSLLRPVPQVLKSRALPTTPHSVFLSQSF